REVRPVRGRSWRALVRQSDEPDIVISFSMTLASPFLEETAADLSAEEHANHALLSGLDTIVALADSGFRSQGDPLGAYARVRDQARLSADWAAINGVTDGHLLR